MDPHLRPVSGRRMTMDGIRYGLMRNPMPVSPVALAIAMVLVSAAGGAAQSRGPRVEVPHVRAATVDGVIDEAEWRGAWRTTLSQGTEVRLMHDGRRLFVGLSKLPGTAGWACAFVAPAGRSPVRVLHASAQLGSAIYDAAGASVSSSSGASGAWSPRSTTYEWKVAERLVREEGWMANVSANGDATAREFAIDLDRVAPTTTTAAARDYGAASGTASATAATTATATATATAATTAAATASAVAVASAVQPASAAEPARFAVAYASITKPDNARGLVAWPESAKDAVRDQRLVDGWNPAGLTFEPTSWAELLFRPAPQP